MVRAWRALAWALGWTVMASASAGAPLTRDDVPLEDYLRVLERITPAARAAAHAYLNAVQAKCGRPMRALELRRRVAEGTGEPVLMAMIRAAHDQDTDALRRLSVRVPCEARP